ncbi:MAG: DMT family transporter [Thomasclavelia sp.]|jgi:drug/metabolite transporter (DMT)-like permease|nr:DMT family transporter [Thomasclavelia sp.]
MSKKYKAIIFIIISAFCFACMNVFVKLAGDLPSVQKSFFRNLVAVFFALIVIKKNNTNLKINKGDLKYLIARASFGTIGILCNFYAVDHLMVADASMLNKLSPFFVIIFSYFLLKEKIKPYQLVCLLIAFVGAIFVIRPTGLNMNMASLVGICGGMCAGLAYTFVRLLASRGVNGSLIVLFFSTFSCLVVLPAVLINYQPMQAYQLGYLLLAGLAATGGQFGVTLAYSNAPGKEISIYDYSQIIFSTILSFIILGEVPPVISFVGYFLIATASGIMFILNKRNNRQDMQ